ncbi:Ferric reductase domain protein transmembrane component domain [Shewanella halifaxensis HAW-EB4]|uniref:Protein-methionine-sulfoxide reductase heme-binding subunit MsrQ n=1 Tax=Shewanella halifaxensis (strain HAW-EB4) TaxID=458817 RepID=B0TRL2_SHEHH|nr:protein-methionine-sulfoxide reductase heme-binding subunit MsrQ [Shewanella halifaxensis]ABZ76430.1 Ferric reductase domain protein transmembrane component domain [Shewanella halifaxensis HAW-EB4]
MRLNSRSVFWLKVLFHLIGILPIAYLVLKVLSDNAGGDPVQYIIHFTGIGALNALAATLLISPIAKRFKLGMLLQTRRLVGLYVFAYASLHVLAFFSLDLLFAWSLFFEEVVKRPYILVGGMAYVLLTALALTSFKGVMRKMGKSWQKLHNWVYAVAILAPVHFYWSVKSEIIEPSLYILFFVVLLGFRVKQSKIYKQMLIKFMRVLTRSKETHSLN